MLPFSQQEKNPQLCRLWIKNTLWISIFFRCAKRHNKILIKKLCISPNVLFSLTLFEIYNFGMVWPFQNYSMGAKPLLKVFSVMVRVSMNSLR